jgi:hypothetical protein
MGVGSESRPILSQEDKDEQMMKYSNECTVLMPHKFGKKH